LPADFRTKFKNVYSLADYDIQLLTEELETALYYDEVCQLTSAYKAAANWINGPLKAVLNEQNLKLTDAQLNSERMAGLIDLVESNKVSFSIASQRILPKMVSEPTNALELAESLNLLMVSNDDELLTLVKEVLLSLPDKVNDYKNGKKALIGLFMGDVMKKSGGKADPKKIKAILEKELS
jgi:aspartyl-tRNA(Asn)/glutamyl-tRNA(Gln) amidotransferase subunit B